MAFGTKEKTNQQNQKESNVLKTPQNITFEKGASIPTSSNINQENVDKNLVASQKPYDFNLKQDYMGTTYNNKPMGLPNKNENPYFMEGESVPIKAMPGDSEAEYSYDDKSKKYKWKKTNQELSAVKTELSYNFQNKIIISFLNVFPLFHIMQNENYLNLPRINTLEALLLKHFFFSYFYYFLSMLTENTS